MFESLLGNDLLSGIIAFILVLIPSVIIHELGHFLAAKSVGITILEFGIGMPPRMVKLFTWKGTEYTLNWLPLGGFVRPLGEDAVRQLSDEEMEKDRTEAESRGIEKTMSVNEAKPLARIFFMAAGAIANFLFAFVLFVLIALIGIRVIEGGRAQLIYVAPASSLADAGLQTGDFIEAINGQKFADTRELLTAISDSDDQVILSIQRGEGEAFDLPISSSLFPSDVLPEGYPAIAAVAEDSPASQAGLQVNDVVMAFNGQAVNAFEDIQQLTRENLDREVTLSIWRSGEPIDTTLTPRANPPEGQGAIGLVFNGNALALIDAENQLAVQDGPPQVVMRSQSVGEAVQYSFGQISAILTSLINLPGELIRGAIAPEVLRPIGPVGVSQAGAEFLRESVERNEPTLILQFIALISISLGLTNLLPIPALDGGRILFVLIEIVRGRPIAPEREGLVHLIGLAMLLSLMVVVIFNDIANPVTDLIR
jgi:regulator of sigma E protease